MVDQYTNFQIVGLYIDDYDDDDDGRFHHFMENTTLIFKKSI